MTTNRIEILNDIVDLHIRNVESIKRPELNDTKRVTEICKILLLLEQIKKVEGSRSEYDNMSNDELESKIEGLYE